MPKRSDYAIALGLHAPPDRKNPGDHRDRELPLRSAADGFYFQLESFLDGWRRNGLREDVVRSALDRAKRASLAMEQVGELLAGR